MSSEQNEWRSRPSANWKDLSRQRERPCGPPSLGNVRESQGASAAGVPREAGRGQSARSWRKPVEGFTDGVFPHVLWMLVTQLTRMVFSSHKQLQRRADTDTCSLYKPRRWIKEALQFWQRGLRTS